jgi:arginyl-tRNA synthetase
MKNELLDALQKAVSPLGISADSVSLDFPESFDHGDFTTNVAMVNAKKLGMKPRDLAEKIVAEFEKVHADAPTSSRGKLSDIIESVNIAGPGFINLKIKDKVFAEEVVKIAGEKIVGGPVVLPSAGLGVDRKIMIEYTDPNPFKIFHIGHLMSNAIGESMARLAETSGAKVIRACYQGDVGLHVAKTIWAILKNDDKAGNGARSWEDAEKLTNVVEKVKYLGDMYVEGSKYDEDKDVQKEIGVINKKIFEKSDPKIVDIYEKGRKWSLEYFDLIYQRLGTSFDQFFFESEVADNGVKAVRDLMGNAGNNKNAVFKESEGAIVFPGEEYGLHTRVFITSQGLPTYEAKEIGLNTQKFKLFPDLSQSVIITANEQDDYFKVLLKVLSLTNPEIAEKTKHMSHGILRFASGKMSSHKGNVISAESLLHDIKKMVTEKISDRKFSAKEADEVADMVAVGAIKYTILRQSVGGDVIFDSSASISFEGDSGPYLQYAAVRGNSILEKAKKEGIGGSKILGLFRKSAKVSQLPEKVGELERLVARFPDIVERAHTEYAPQYVANYLISLASTFNSFYASQMIVSKQDPLSPYYVALTKAFVNTMTSGLWILGIKVPRKM